MRRDRRSARARRAAGRSDRTSHLFSQAAARVARFLRKHPQANRPSAMRQLVVAILLTGCIPPQGGGYMQPATQPTALDEPTQPEPLPPSIDTSKKIAAPSSSAASGAAYRDEMDGWEVRTPSAW